MSEELINDFPLEIFSTTIQNSFKSISDYYAVPIEYFASTALFGINSLSGNLYEIEEYSDIKTALFFLLIGPSGIGKSVPYEQLIGNIINPLNIQLEIDFKKKQYQYLFQEKKHDRRTSEVLQLDNNHIVKPTRTIRMAQGGTPEGYRKHMITSPAGFGIYYDEIDDMLQINAYKADKGTLQFWCTLSNVSTSFHARADENKEGLMPSTNVGLLGGTQTDRIPEFFNSQTIKTGFAFRFLVTLGKYKDMTDINNSKDKTKRSVCSEWIEKIQYLYNRGLTFNIDTKPFYIKFESEQTFNYYETLLNDLRRQGNKNRKNVKEGEVSSIMIQVDSKLAVYFSRFIKTLAILDNPQLPVIRKRNLDNAKLLYIFYWKNAREIFNITNETEKTNFSATEKNFLDALPIEYNLSIVKETQNNLKLGDRFHDHFFRKKLEPGRYVKRIKNGEYKKII